MGEVLLISGYSGDLNDLLIGFLGSCISKPGRGRIFLYSFNKDGKEYVVQ